MNGPIRLFVTNVATGRGRVFRNAELTPAVLLASACLPTLFQAVEIEGEACWDGGFSGTSTGKLLTRNVNTNRVIPSGDFLFAVIHAPRRPESTRTGSLASRHANRANLSAGENAENRLGS